MFQNLEGPEFPGDLAREGIPDSHTLPPRASRKKKMPWELTEMTRRPWLWWQRAGETPEGTGVQGPKKGHRSYVGMLQW